MKLVWTTLLILAGVFGVSCDAKYPRSTPEELGNSVFAALRANDRAAVQEMILTEEEMLLLVDENPYAQGEEAQRRAEFREKWPQQKENIQTGIGKKFDRVVQQIQAKGKLSDLELLEVVVDPIDRRGSLRVTRIYLVTQLNREEIILRIKQANSINREWSLGMLGFSIYEQPFR
ncbi:MAG: hypothetical protein AAGN35_23470 [Bacteroidota bacterium]